MAITEQELIAARQLGETFLKFLIAWEQGTDERRRQQLRSTSNVARPSADKEPTTELQRGRRTESEPLLLTLLETAKLLRVSDRHLRKMSFPTGPIPVVKIGGRLLYSKKDIEAAIEKFRATTQQPDSP